MGRKRRKERRLGPKQGLSKHRCTLEKLEDRWMAGSLLLSLPGGGLTGMLLGQTLLGEMSSLSILPDDHPEQPWLADGLQSTSSSTGFTTRSPATGSGELQSLQNHREEAYAGGSNGGHTTTDLDRFSDSVDTERFGRPGSQLLEDLVGFSMLTSGLFSEDHASGQGGSAEMGTITPQAMYRSSAAPSVAAVSAATEGGIASGVSSSGPPAARSSASNSIDTGFPEPVSTSPQSNQLASPLASEPDVKIASGSSAAFPPGTSFWKSAVENSTSTESQRDPTGGLADPPISSINLGFDDGLDGWIASQAGGSGTGHGDVTEGSAVLTEGDSFLVTLQRPITIPDQAQSITIRYTDLSFDTTDPSFINDAFEVALLDSGGNTLVHTFSPGRDAFFNVTEEQEIVVGEGTDVSEGDVTTVDLDISELYAATEATLFFRLVNNDADVATTVTILDVTIGGADSPPSVIAALENDTAPSGPGTEPFQTDGLTNDPDIIGTASDDFGLTTLAASVDGGAFQDITASLVAGQFLYDPGTLAPGPHSITVRAGDTLGQTRDTTVDFTVNTPPLANAGSSQTVQTGETVQFDGSASWDLDAALYAHQWTFHDGATASGVTTSRVYADPGTFLVTLTVTDTAGSQHTAQMTVTVEEAATILNPAIANDDGDWGFRVRGIWSLQSGGWHGDYRTKAPGNGSSYASWTLRVDPGQYEVFATWPGGSQFAADAPYTIKDGAVIRAAALRRDQRSSPDDGEYDGAQWESLGVYDTTTGVVSVELSDKFAAGLVAADGIILVPAGSPFHAAGASANSAENQLLTLAELEPIAAQAIASWVSVGNDPSIAGALADIDFRVTDLSGSTLGLASPGVVWIDEDAAGHGWFVDPTPADHEEFTATTEALEFPADTQSPAAGRMDLLTVVTHELGHLLGQEDLGVTEHAHDLMAESIMVGVRRMPVAESMQVHEPVSGQLKAQSSTDSIILSADIATHDGEVAAGVPILVTGRALAVGQAPAVTHVTINGIPVDAIDTAGNFFAQITPSLGQITLAVVATNEADDTAEVTLALTSVPSVTSNNDLSALDDVSGSLVGQYGRTSFNEDSNVLYTDLAIRNDGSYPADVPLLVGITNLSDPSVRVRGFDGTTPGGIPYFDLSSLVDDGTLDPGEVTGSQAVSFSNPARSHFSYDLVILGRLNEDPAINTVPDVEALPGRAYQYDVEANDPDGDALTYSLLTGPSGLTVDPVTGNINWIPGTADLGTHTIAVEVEDGRGGFDRQQFVLSVIEPPPNRPPVFKSTPLVDANVNADYSYTAFATDADGDTVTYSLTGAPVGMDINSATGQIQWTPSGNQASLSDVTVMVSDGHGGSAIQSFSILVLGDRDNAAPVFVSDPVTHFALPGLSNTPVGDATPSSLDLNLGLGDATIHNVSLTLPTSGVSGQADLVFVVDESGSTTGDHAWLAGMVPQLDAALEEAGIGPNRFALMGYSRNTTSYAGIDIGQLGMGHPFPSRTGKTDVKIHQTVFGLATGDVNGDGHLDAVVRKHNHWPGIRDNIGAVQVLLGNGDGTLSPLPPVYTDLSMQGGFYDHFPYGDLDLGDVNGDGYLDVLTTSVIEDDSSGEYYRDHVAFVLLGRGDGTLAPPAVHRLLPEVQNKFLQVQFEDMNGDGRLDIAGIVRHRGANIQGAAVLLGNGDGTFAPAIERQFFTDLTFAYTTIGDLDADGAKDLVCVEGFAAGAIESTASRLFIFWGNGDGTFEAEMSPYFGGFNPTAVGLADLDQDGDLDMLADNGHVLLNQGQRLFLGHDEYNFRGVLLSYQALPSGDTDLSVGTSVVLQDVNSDGTVDALISTSFYDELSNAIGSMVGGRVVVALGRGDGTFDSPTAYGDFGGGGVGTDPSTGWTFSIADMDGDGHPDLVTSNASHDLREGSVSVILGNGDGTFGGVLFGTSAQFATSATSLSSLGRRGDGYEGVTTALSTYLFRDEAAASVVLLTSNNRDDLLSALTFDTVRADLQQKQATFDVLLDGPTTGEGGQTALGVRADKTAYVADGGGQFTDATGGAFAGSSTLKQQYVDLAWDSGGTTWDLNQLRTGGTTADSFTTAFIAAKVAEISSNLTGGPARNVDLIASDPAAPFANLTGTVSDVQSRQTATFQTEFTGDGLARSFDLLFVEAGTGNELGRIPVTINAQYLYGAQAMDPDGDPLVFGLASSPPDASINAQTGQITWKPTQAGLFQFTVTAEDGRGGRATQEFGVRISLGEPNQSPTLQPATAATASVGRPFEYGMTGSDPDGDRLAYYLTTPPAGVSIDFSTGLIQWTPTAEQVGPHSLLVRVLDGRGGEAIQTLQIQVEPAAENLSPRFVSTPLRDAVSGQPYRYPARAVDGNGDKITFDLVVKAKGMVIEPFSGQIAWTPNEEQVGSHPVIVRARDPFGGVDLQSFEVNVVTFNTPPVISSKPPLFANVGLPYEYRASGQDAEGDPLEFYLEAAPAGMTIDSTTGIISWIPSAAGDSQVNLGLRDGRGGSDVQSFTIAALANAPNDPPVITSSPPQTILLGSTYRYLVAANDPNGDRLTFLLDTAPLGMMLSPDGFIEWRPDASQVGLQAVALSVGDGRNGIATQSFAIDVITQFANQPPIIVTAPPPTATVDRQYQYAAEAVDPEGDLLLWSLDVAPRGMSIDSLSGSVRWRPQIHQIGQHQVVIRVDDGQGSFDQQAFQVLVRGINQPPLIVSSPPTLATAGRAYTYAVRASDPDGDLLEFSLVAAPNFMSIDAASGVIRWTPPGDLQGAERVLVRVADGRGGIAEQTYDILVTPPRNFPPYITSVPEVQAAVAVGEPYRYQIAAVDPEGETLTYSLGHLTDPQRSVNGIVSGTTFDPTTGFLEWTPPADYAGAYMSGSIHVTDPQGGLAWQAFTFRVRPESGPPQIRSSPVTYVMAGGTYRYDVQAVDPDGDAMTFALTESPLGMSVDRFGRIAWLPEVTARGYYSVTVLVTDSTGKTATQSFPVLVGADATFPGLHMWLSSHRVPVGSLLQTFIVASDASRRLSHGLSVGGRPVVLDQNGQATVVLDQIGEIEIVGTATDASGNIAVARDVITVFQPGPAIEITSPAVHSTITGPLDVIAAVPDGTSLIYTLSMAPVGSNAFTTIANGNGPVSGGRLGRIDPSALPNGSYVLRLETSETDTTLHTFSVAGDLKLGNFTLSFTDLSIPVSGIPITLSRTYDSLTANQQDEFGYGWRMEIRDTDLRTSVVKTGMEEDLIYNPFFDGAKVYVSRPGEAREGFTFSPKPGKYFSYLKMWEPYFEPDAGVTSTLTVEKYPLLRLDDGAFVGYTGGGSYNPASSLFGGTFTLTTKEGLQYEIDGTTGDARKITDTNGNALSFTDEGIFSTAGKEIRFERDPQGRIEAVIDPLGERIRYAYDARGDLVSVTDREGNVTRFEYRTDRPHYLEKVIDPLGRTGVKSVYDDQGRLVQMIDADGNPVELIHDPDNFTETVKDQLGNPTIYEYDTLGNVVTEIDAEGSVTKRTYTDPNNPTLETSVTVVLEDGTELTTQFAYDTRGNVLEETDPLGNVTRYTYGPLGQVLTTTDPLGNTTTNAYDAAGNLLSMTDPAGTTTSFSYDTSGNPLEMAIGTNVTKFQYDGVGNVTRQEDAEGTVRTFTYDAAGNQLTESVTYTTPSGPSTVLTENEYDADGRVVKTTTMQDGVVLTTSQTVYDAAGNRVQSIDALGRRTKFDYDDRGLMTETVYPDATPLNDSDNPRTKTEYDAAGRVTAEIDQLGRRTWFEYDKTGRQTKTFFPDETPLVDTDNPFTETVYDVAGRTIAQIDERGNRTEFVYDAAGNQIATILPDATPSDLKDNPRITSIYDAAGHQVSTIDPLGNVTTSVFDDAGRPAETVFADGSSTSTGFDDQGRVTSRADQNGNITRYEYDDLGRLTAVVQTVDGTDLRTEYEYDELGSLVVQRDANGHETRYEYDGLARRIATALPLGQRSETTYDAAGRVESTTDFNGDTILFQYDTLDRLTKKDFPSGPDTTFTYTLTGQRETVTDARGVTSYDYDARERLLSRADPDGSAISYTYDAAGNRTSVTTQVLANPPRTTQYTFDEQDRQKTVTDPEGGLTTYFYDTAGRLVRTEFPNGTFETRQYDTLHRLEVLESSGPGGVLDRYDYDVDAVGNRLSVTELDGRHVQYSYDEIYRLLGESIFDPGVATPSRTIDYDYDAVGNRLARNDSTEGLTSYTYDANDLLLTETLAGDTARYVYDANGNTLRKIDNATDAVLTEYQWDVENRLVAADADGNGTFEVQNEYDADGIRVSQVVSGDETRFFIDTVQPYAQVLEEYTPGGIIKVSYVHGLDLISQNRPAETGKSFYHVDGLGSTRAMTNASGLITDRYIYDAFGRTIGQVGSTRNAYLFAGEQRDSNVALDYLRARYMSPGAGRFMGRDVFGGHLQTPVTLHRFLYGNGNPINLVDPSGQFSLVSLSVGQGIQNTLSTIARVQTFVQANKNLQLFLGVLGAWSFYRSYNLRDLKAGFVLETPLPSTVLTKVGIARFTDKKFNYVQLRFEFSESAKIKARVDLKYEAVGYQGAELGEFLGVGGQAGINIPIHTFIGPLGFEIGKLELALRGGAGVSSSQIGFELTIGRGPLTGKFQWPLPFFGSDGIF